MENPSQDAIEDTIKQDSELDALPTNDAAVIKSSPLLRLPPEVRREIVRLVLLETDVAKDPETGDQVRGLRVTVGRDGLPLPMQHPLLCSCRLLREDAISVRWDVVIFHFDRVASLREFSQRFPDARSAHPDLAVEVVILGAKRPGQSVRTRAKLNGPLAVSPFTQFSHWFDAISSVCRQPLVILNIREVYRDFDAIRSLACLYGVQRIRPVVVFQPAIGPQIDWLVVSEDMRPRSGGMSSQCIQTVSVDRDRRLQEIQWTQKSFFNLSAWWERATRAAIADKPLPPIEPAAGLNRAAVIHLLGSMGTKGIPPV